MVLAAARQGGMRQCLIAILAAKALPRQASFCTAPFVCRTMSELLLGVELLVRQFSNFNELILVHSAHVATVNTFPASTSSVECCLLSQRLLHHVNPVRSAMRQGRNIHIRVPFQPWPLMLQGIEQALTEACRAVPGLRPPSGDIRSVLNHIADFRSPGRYHVKRGVLHEIEGLSLDDAPAAVAAGDVTKPQASQIQPSPAAGQAAPARKQPAAKQPKAAKQPNGDVAGGAGAGSVSKRRGKEPAPGQGQAAKRPKQSRSAAPAAAAPPAAVAPPAAAALPAAAAPLQPAPVMADTSPAASSAGSPPEPPVHSDWLGLGSRPSPPPAVAADARPSPEPRHHHQPASQRPERPSPPPASAAARPPQHAGFPPPGKSSAFRASIASPTPTPTPSPRDGSGRLGSSAGGSGSGGRWGTSSSGSRSSAQYDESWFAPHVSRAASLAPPIASLEQVCRSCQAALAYTERLDCVGAVTLLSQPPLPLKILQSMSCCQHGSSQLQPVAAAAATQAAIWCSPDCHIRV